MERLNRKGGFVTATVVMAFTIIVTVVLVTSSVVMNGWRSNKKLNSHNNTLTHAEYGSNLGFDAIFQTIAQADADKRMEYKADLSLLVEDSNERAVELDKATSDVYDHTVEIALGDKPETLSVLTTARDNKGSERKTQLTVDNVIQALGEEIIIPGAMPDLSSAIVTESRVELSGGVVKGEILILDPKPKQIYVKQSFGTLEDSTQKGHTTKGIIYIQSKGGEITYDNVHEIFEFQGMPMDDSKAKLFFETARHSNGQAYLVRPRKDKIKIIDDTEIALPNVKGIKIPNNLNTAPNYEIKEMNSSRTFKMVQDGVLQFPTSSWQYVNNNKIVYPLRDNYYFKEINMKSSSVVNVIDVGDRDIEVVTDKLVLDNHIEVIGTGSLTIHVTDKALSSPAVARNNLSINPKGIVAKDEKGVQDNRKLVLALHTPESFKGNPLPVKIQSWSDTSLSIIAKHMKLHVVGKVDVNALSWGETSSAVVDSSATFKSNLFYFKNGKIDYKANYFYGSLIGKEVDMANSSPTIENNEVDTPEFSGFPLEMDWENLDGTASSGAEEITLDDPRPSLLRKRKFKEVR